MEKFLKITRAIFLLALASAVFLAAYVFFLGVSAPANDGNPYQTRNAQKSPLPKSGEPAVQSQEDTLPEGERLSVRDVKADVPFISQAPTGNWDEQIFQDGCEEASIIMALYWARGESLDAKKAEAEMRALSDYEIRTRGFAVDISAKDTMGLMRDYYAFDKTELKENATADDIKQALLRGSVVIVPVHGRTLANPHYTSPGPVAHMLVVTGYDAGTKEFITNDPGTRFGASYRYGERKFMEAVWDYPTGGAHAEYPGRGQASRAMIAVSK